MYKFKFSRYDKMKENKKIKLSKDALDYIYISFSILFILHINCITQN